MEMMYRYSEVNQGEIGEVMGGLDYTSGSRERRLLREKIHKGTELRRWSRAVEKRYCHSSRFDPITKFAWIELRHRSARTPP